MTFDFNAVLTLAIVVLTTLVGTNHLVTILSGKTSSLHEVFAVVNYAAVAVGSAALFSRQGRSHNGQSGTFGRRSWRCRRTFEPR
jgi:hypothetical protein